MSITSQITIYSLLLFEVKWYIIFTGTHWLIYLLIVAALGLHCYTRLSLVSKNRRYSLAVVCGLLSAVASLVAEHRL